MKNEDHHLQIKYNFIFSTLIIFIFQTEMQAKPMLLTAAAARLLPNPLLQPSLSSRPSIFFKPRSNIISAAQSSNPHQSTSAADKSPSSKGWSFDSWKSKKAAQLSEYPDEATLESVLKTIDSFPPIVFAGEARSLEENLGQAALGNAFLLLGGDCAVSFKEFSANNIGVGDTLRVLGQKGVVVMFDGQIPVIKLGSTGGQFAKPRSDSFEEKDGVKLPSYGGDYFNGDAFDEKSRIPENALDNTIICDSEYEDGLGDIRIRPPDPSLVDFDISSFQFIRDVDLEKVKVLGSGTFGTVYHGKWRGSDVAIKRFKNSCFTGHQSEQERLITGFWMEAGNHSKLHHPNVVAFYGVVQDGPGRNLGIVTEYMVDGSLRRVLRDKDRHLDRMMKLVIAMDAAFGMEYLHSKNIVHFDLKCDNLLMNCKDPSRPICKVGDFGLSKIKRNTLVSAGVRGTLPWMAPELFKGSSNKVSEKVDVFSFGIVLWEILTGEQPYANMQYGEIIGGIFSNTLRPTIPSYCDSEWRILMEQCWAQNPAVRPSFTEIANRLRVMSMSPLPR